MRHAAPPRTWSTPFPRRSCSISPKPMSSWRASRPRTSAVKSAATRRQDRTLSDRTRRGRRRVIEGDDGVFVTSSSHVGEDLALGDPGEGVFVDLLAVGLEDDALARAPASRVHGGMEAFGKFTGVIVGIALRSHVDIALRAAQRAAVASHVSRIGLAIRHRTDPEAR